MDENAHDSDELPRVFRVSLNNANRRDISDMIHRRSQIGGPVVT